MKSIIQLLYTVYQIVFVIPMLIVLTMLTAISTIVLSYLTKNPRIWAVPSQIWSKLICLISFVRVEVKGRENIAPNKSYVITANHQSAFDIWIIYGWLGSPFSWVMKKELRKIPLVGLACERIGHIFIDRSNPVEARKSMESAKKILQNGQCVVIFPEGTRTKTGKLGDFKRGAFNMASDLQLPIVPVTINGSYERIAKNGWQFRPGKIQMIIHEPIEVNEKLSEQEIKNLAQQTKEIVIQSLV